MKNTNKPLVYSCSGCSQVAQLANRIAVDLDRNDVAEMSCIAGIGGQVKAILKLARSGRPVLAIDGCPLCCVQKSLHHIGVTADHHLLLSDFGLKKRQHEEYSDADVKHFSDLIKSDIIPLISL
ncbi:putative zinc-binding protein [Bacterioplanoides pacificum]|uniref:Zinc-binding protein n=1 Tax=Bacterioplanoides pacificum TaxID=1171596 RepID=A0ABV7VX80_9GAMM